MNTEPITQRKIYGLDYYFNEIVDLYNNNKLPNKILLSGPKGNGKSTLAYHIINYIQRICTAKKFLRTAGDAHMH